MDVIETLDTAEVAVKGEIARDLSENNPVHQLFEQLGMALEGRVRVVLLALAKAPEFQRIVFPRRAHVVGDDVVVRNHMALVGVIPEPPHVLDLVSAVADQGVVDGDHPARRIARRGGVLQPVQAMFVEQLFIPGHLRNPAIQAGLIRGVGKLGVDRRYVFALRHHKPGQVFAEMPALRGIGKQPAKLLQRLLDHGGKSNNAWHRRPLSSHRQGRPRRGMPSFYQKYQKNRPAWGCLNS